MNWHQEFLVRARVRHTLLQSGHEPSHAGLYLAPLGLRMALGLLSTGNHVLQSARVGQRVVASGRLFQTRDDTHTRLGHRLIKENCSHTGRTTGQP